MVESRALPVDVRPREKRAVGAGKGVFQGNGERAAHDAHVLFHHVRRRPSIRKLLREGLHLLAEWRAQVHLPKGGLMPWLCAAHPFASFGQGVGLEKLLPGHFCGLFAFPLPVLRPALPFRLLPLVGQTLRAFSRADTTQPGKRLIGFFRVPSLGGPPAASFLCSVNMVEGGKVSVRLPVPRAPCGLLM